LNRQHNVFNRTGIIKCIKRLKPIPEKRDESVEALKARLSGPFIVQTIFNRKNKTGRIFGILYETENEKSINAQMVEDGLLEKFEQAA